MLVEAENTIHAGLGDRVVISFETSSLLKATFLIYVFPILCMIAGAALGQALGPKFDLNASAASALTGFAFFFAALGFMKTKGNQLAQKKEYKPKIIRVLKPIQPTRPAGKNTG